MLSFGAIPLLNGDANDGDSASIRSVETARAQAHRQSTAQLMKQGGVKRPWLKYASYYIPSLNWMSEYQLGNLAGDVVAGGKEFYHSFVLHPFIEDRLEFATCL